MIRLLLTTLMLTLVLVSAGCNRQTTPPTPAAIPTEAAAPRAPAATPVPAETVTPAGAEQPGEPYPPPGLVATPAGVYPEPESATPTP